MTTFVLIPGAGGTAWYWHLVTPILEQAGHEAIAIDLPGDDETAGLREYTEIVTAAMAGRDEVVIGAQSLGAFTAAMAAPDPAVRGLVFINAMIPTPGETARDWWANTGWEQARVEAAERGGYGTEFDLSTYFLHDVAPDVAAAGEPFQRPEADAVFESVCNFRAWPDVPIRALAGADDRFFPASFQQRVARDRLGIEADTRPGGHLIAIAQPATVAEYLLATPLPTD